MTIHISLDVFITVLLFILFYFLLVQIILFLAVKRTGHLAIRDGWRVRFHSRVSFCRVGLVSAVSLYCGSKR